MLYLNHDNRVSVLPCNPNGVSPFFVHRPFTLNWFDLVIAKHVLVYACSLASKKPRRTLVRVWRRVDRPSAMSSTKANLSIFNFLIDFEEKTKLTRLSSFFQFSIPINNSLSDTLLGGVSHVR